MKSSRHFYASWCRGCINTCNCCCDNPNSTSRSLYYDDVQHTGYWHNQHAKTAAWFLLNMPNYGCIPIQRLHPSVPRGGCPNSNAPSNAALFSLFLEDALLLSLAASHIPRFFVRPKKKKERKWRHRVAYSKVSSSKVAKAGSFEGCSPWIGTQPMWIPTCSYLSCDSSPTCMPSGCLDQSCCCSPVVILMWLDQSCN